MDVNGAKDIIARELNLAERARQDATNGTPMGEIIPDIVAAAKGAGNKEVDTLRRQRKEAEESINALKGVVTDVAKKLVNPVSGLDALKRNVDVAEKHRDTTLAQYNKFKQANGIEMNASGDDRLVQICWAFFIVIVEGGLNSYFFEPAFEAGYAGGFLAAFFISFINVAVAFIGGGLGLRYGLNHIKPHKRLGGLVFFFGCAAVCAGTVAVSAYFRGNVDMLLRDGADIEKIAQMAWERSLDNLRQLDLLNLLQSFDSFLLVFVGALCAFFGFWKGYEFDDPYPGFGRRQRQLDDAQEELTEAIKEYEQKAGVRNRQLVDIKNGLADAGRKARTNVERLEKKCKESGGLPADIQRLAQGLLNFYCGVYRPIYPKPAGEVGPIPDEPFAFLADKYDEIARDVKQQFDKTEADFSRAQERVDSALSGQGAE